VGCRKLITLCGTFAAVSHRIWQSGPWNVEKFAVENCGPIVLLVLTRPLMGKLNFHVCLIL